jgi:hypothetical protein
MKIIPPWLMWRNILDASEVCLILVRVPTSPLTTTGGFDIAVSERTQTGGHVEDISG